MNIAPGKSRIEWALRNYYIKDEKLSLRNHKYLVDIYVDEHPKICVKKSAQCGISEWLIVDTTWSCDIFGARVAYYMPYQVDANDFSKDRVSKAIEESPYLKVMARPPQNVTLKHIGLGSIYLRGADRMRAVVSIPVDNLIRDERDLMNQDIVPAMEKRLGASNLKWTRDVSNPSIPGFGIDRLYLESDQRQWHIKCDHCNFEQVPDFFKNVIVSTNGKKSEFVCQKCGLPIDRLMDGEWRPTYPGREVHGYHISKLFNPNTPLDELVKDSQRISESEIQAFFNFDLGLARSPAGGQVTRNTIEGCIKPDYLMPKVFDKPTTAGVDVGTLFHIRISQKTEQYYKAIFIGTCKAKTDLISILKKFNVGTCVIDALPETRISKEIADELKGKVHLAYFQDHKELLKKNIVDKYQIVTINRNQACDGNLAMYEQKLNTLPQNILDIPDYEDQITAMIRVITKDKNGQEVVNWVSSKPDHYFFAELYDKIAGMMGERKIFLGWA